jgi:rhodanese-related sulfurtransferase
MFARLMGLRTISPDGLHRRMHDGEPVTVFDVNAPSRWAQAHLPGASNLDPMGYDEGELPTDKSAALVFYCSNRMCRKAPRAAIRAKQMGYDNVHVMSAGITGWLTANLPTEAGT